MSRQFVLDFDGTLIDTDVYWAWVIDRFVEHGLDAQRVREVGERLFPKAYSVIQHARDLGLTEVQAQELAMQNRKYVEENHASLVFPDVVPFLFRVEGRKRILTFGHKEHQTQRVYASGLVPPITDIHIATVDDSKAAQLARIIDGSFPMIFIDDDVHQLAMVHEAGLPIELVRMRRPGARNSIIEHDLDHKAWRVIESFEEL